LLSTHPMTLLHGASVSPQQIRVLPHRVR
jgi:hypothetical protein